MLLALREQAMASERSRQSQVSKDRDDARHNRNHPHMLYSNHEELIVTNPCENVDSQHPQSGSSSAGAAVGRRWRNPVRRRAQSRRGIWVTDDELSLGVNESHEIQVAQSIRLQRPPAAPAPAPQTTGAAATEKKYISSGNVEFTDTLTLPLNLQSQYSCC
jgi:hypothetical protein